jgi:hypothetical protein
MLLTAPEAAPASEGYAARIEELNAEIARLEEERGDALLQGLDFDAEKLADLRRELADCDLLFAAQTRLDRKAAEEVRQAQRRLAKREILAQEEKRLDACDRAEKAARELVQALLDVRAALKAIAVENARLGNGGMVQLSVGETERRLSRRLTNLFEPLRRGLRFGRIEFGHALSKAESSGTWREDEEAIAALEIRRATKEGP